jgi:hypothetical protein
LKPKHIAGLTSGWAILLASSIALACFISFEPESVRAGADGRAEFDAVIRWEHRKCVLDDDDVNLDAKGLKVVSQTGWEQVKRGYFTNHIVVQLTAKEGSLRVWRDCSKKGISEHSIRVVR